MPHFARSSRRTVRHWPNGGVSYYDCRVEVHRSARKHGISDDDIHTAAQQYLIAYTIDDDQPPRELRLGFDTRGRLLEIVRPAPGRRHRARHPCHEGPTAIPRPPPMTRKEPPPMTDNVHDRTAGGTPVTDETI